MPIRAFYALVTDASFAAIWENLALQLATFLFHVCGPFGHLAHNVICGVDDSLAQRGSSH
jgi:hypothetical protein